MNKKGFLIVLIITLLINCFFIFAQADNSNYIFLSDIAYEPESKVGWGTIRVDKNIEGGTISLLCDNEVVSFVKGMGAHATSNLIYDVSKYTSEYSNFVSYLGVDHSRGNNGNGVIFEIYTSMDKSSWTKVYTSKVLKGNTNSEFVNIDIKGINYLKLTALHNGNNAADHSVYADARLIKEGYDIKSELISEIKPTSAYDTLIKNTYNGEMTDELKKLVLERTFVSRFGYQTLQQFAKQNSSNKEALTYIFNNSEVLNFFVTGGTIDRGSYLNVLNAWTSLYNKYKDDWVNYATNDTDLMHLKMAISLALVNSRGIGFWTGSTFASLPAERYAIYKTMIENGNFDFVSTNSTDKFRNLPIELMRWVMNNMIHDDEITWLANTAKAKAAATGNVPDRFLSAYSYIRYTSGFNYNKDIYYDEANYSKWNAKYNLDSISFPEGVSDKSRLFEYGTRGYHRLWMVFEDGSVCGGLAKTYANLAQTFGIPAAVIGQPGHAAAVRLQIGDNGIGTWSLLNDVSGWAKSEKGERLPLAWGSTNWDSYYNVSYLLLAQNALNEYDNLENAMYYNYIADIYANNPKKQIEIYQKAKDIQNTNFDAYVGLINAYKNDSTKTSKDFLDLAREIVDTFTYYPTPMVDLLNLIKNNVIGEDLVNYDILKRNALEKATVATSSDVLQPQPCQQVAKAILNTSSDVLATFSFDGPNAGKIVLNEKYNDSDVRIKYTLFGIDENSVFTETNEHVIALTPEQLASITAEDDIVIGLVGSNDTFVIDIKDAVAPNNSILYANDWENRFIGRVAALEFSLDEGKTWCDYTSDIRFTDNKEVIVRYKATGTTLASTTAKYNFTLDNDTKKEKYIPIEDISIHNYSSQQSTNSSSAAINIIDGSINTAWHTTWNGEANKYISVKFNDIKHISALDYVPGGQNGRFKSGEVYSSLDGENWSLIHTFSGLANNVNVKHISFGSSYEAKYIRVKVTESYGNTSGEINKYASGKMLNFYEDIAWQFTTDAEVSYSTKELTNQDVRITLINKEETTVITNNNGSDNYTFTANGEFTFELVDEYGNTGKIKAVVDWIDKEVPTAEVTFDTTESTAESVTATLKFSEDVDILNNMGKNYYTFTENGTFIFLFKDKAGNNGSKVVTIDWLNKKDAVVDEKKEPEVSFNIFDNTGVQLNEKFNHVTENILSSDVISSLESQIKDNTITEEKPVITPKPEENEKEQDNDSTSSKVYNQTEPNYLVILILVILITGLGYVYYNNKK